MDPKARNLIAAVEVELIPRYDFSSSFNRGNRICVFGAKPTRNH